MSLSSFWAGFLLTCIAIPLAHDVLPSTPVETSRMQAAKCLPVHRSRAVLRHFQHRHPCPVTGLTTGPCPGYVKDHIAPLCLTGSAGDTVENLQWQTIPEAKVKDIWEREQCRQAGCQHRGD